MEALDPSEGLDGELDLIQDATLELERLIGLDPNAGAELPASRAGDDKGRHYVALPRGHPWWMQSVCGCPAGEIRKALPADHGPRTADHGP